MYTILSKKKLNSTVTQMDILAPRVADKAKPGQFIILRVDENGERIPLTVAHTDPQNGSVRIIFQTVGATTMRLDAMNAGDSLCDFVGPLGKATDTQGLSRVCVIGGGVGCAIAMPIAEALHTNGSEVTSLIGFRNKDLIILEDEFRSFSDELIVMTDDGSYGRKGNVTEPLREMLENGTHFDRIFAIGPLVMMKYVALTSKPYCIPLTVSMNSIMIDGTGMCGGCRLSLDRDGKRITQFACVDGPEFNGYEIDYDEAMSRAGMYADFERKARDEACRLFGRC